MNKPMFVSIIFPIFVLLAGCNKVSDYPEAGKDKGELVIKITDDPIDISFIESATVTLTKIEIRKNVGDQNSSFIVLMEDTVTVDLLKLRNGVIQVLADKDIPAGEYDLIRLYVDQATLTIIGQPMPYIVKIPSGKQTGIKIFIQPEIVVNNGLTSELLLDFDLSRSFVLRGDLSHASGVNGFIFKPFVRAANLSESGRIVGVVADTAEMKIANAKVWLNQDSLVTTAFTDSTGYYAFLGIPEGTYSIYANKEGFDTVWYTDIMVLAGNRTEQNFILNPE